MISRYFNFEYCSRYISLFAVSIEFSGKKVKKELVIHVV